MIYLDLEPPDAEVKQRMDRQRMIIVTAWTLWRRHPTAPIATAWLIQGVLHAGFHMGHLDEYETIDKLGLLASLAAIPVLAAIALWAGRTPHAESNVQ